MAGEVVEEGRRQWWLRERKRDLSSSRSLVLLILFSLGHSWDLFPPFNLAS